MIAIEPMHFGDARRSEMGLGRGAHRAPLNFG